MGENERYTFGEDDTGEKYIIHDMHIYDADTGQQFFIEDECNLLNEYYEKLKKIEDGKCFNNGKSEGGSGLMEWTESHRNYEGHNEVTICFDDEGRELLETVVELTEAKAKVKRLTMKLKKLLELDEE